MSDRLNPLQVQTSDGPTPTPPPLQVGDGIAAMWWTVMIALAPLVCEVVITAVIGARPLSSIGLFHVGLSVFGLTLAALVRILSHGRGSAFLPFLFVIALLEVILALYSGGTFSQHAVQANRIERDIASIERVSHVDPPGSMSSTALARIRDDLGAVQDSDPRSTTGGYLLLALLGLFSVTLLIRYWGGPTAPERLQASKGTHGGS